MSDERSVVDNEAIQLYEIGTDDAFRRLGRVQLDSSLGLDREGPRSADPDPGEGCGH